MMTRHVYLGHRQRSAGRHLVGPIWASTEHHRHPGIKTRYVNLTVGNPRVHYAWAFSLTVFYRK